MSIHLEHAPVFLTLRAGMAWIGENEVSWRFPLAFQIVFALIIFGTILNLPESPRWLVMQGHDEDAMEVLVALNEKPRDDPFIRNEFESVKATVREMSKGSYKSLFQMTEYREFHRVALAYVNQMFQQISGINLITASLPFYHGSSSTFRTILLTICAVLCMSAVMLVKQFDMTDQLLGSIVV